MSEHYTKLNCFAREHNWYQSSPLRRRCKTCGKTQVKLTDGLRNEAKWVDEVITAEQGAHRRATRSTEPA